MKPYRVYDGRSPEAVVMWLTPAQVVEYRRMGYRVTEV